MSDKDSRTDSLERLSGELTTIIDAIPGLVFYKDNENRFIRVNKYVADAYNMTKEELEGANLFDLHSREMAQSYLDDDLEVINSGKPKLSIDEAWETEKGTRWVSTSKIPYVDESGRIIGIIGVSMDVTERRQAEDALARKNEITRAINQVFRRALTCDTEEETARMALQVAEGLTSSGFGYIGEVNREGLFDTIALSDPGWQACLMPGSSATTLVKGMQIRGIWGRVLREGKSQIVNEPASDPDRTGIPKGHPPIGCFLGVPLVREGKTTGMIALANKQGGYTEEDREAIETLSVAVYEALVRKRMEIEVRGQSLLKSGHAELADRMTGDLAPAELCDKIIAYLCEWFEVPAGLMYLAGKDGVLEPAAGYALLPEDGRGRPCKPGEGLVGQAALDKKEIVVTEVPDDYFTIGSGLGQSRPRAVYIKPVLQDGRVLAVVELAALGEFDPLQSRFLETVSESIAFALESARARERQAELLEKSQRQAEELQLQQEELKAANEELEEQTQRLKDSEEKLKAQQEEMEVTNEELEEKNELLERQKKDVERARREIAEKAEDLALASRYKSEFLANMSHELRTPLNSLLLLARSLAENKDGNMSAEQVESAEVIYQSGSDLLSLINEILDLSRIEAGRMELHIDRVEIAELAGSLETTFAPLAGEKEIEFSVTVGDGSPTTLETDRKRVEQVLMNLVSNAVKFTERGEVKVTFDRAPAGVEFSRGGLDAARVMSVKVEDTGIGIPPEHQKAIFEAFRQSDGGTARRFGGTGLGLSISRELVGLLGGEIRLQSRPGEGSTFNVYLPLDGPGRQAEIGPENPAVGEARPRDEKPARKADSIPDDRRQIESGDRSILIIEDDPRFAGVLAGQCREKGFKVLAAASGEDGIELARRFVPRGILLDLKLPGMDGWRVLDLIKEDPEIRHIPVHIASVDEPTTRAMQKGAVGYVQKPLTPEDIAAALKKMEQAASRGAKSVLVVEDDQDTRRGIVELIEDDDVEADEVEEGGQALEALRQNKYDCMILDLGLRDCDGRELLKRISRGKGIQVPPVIVYTARDLSWEEDLELRSYSDSIIIKGARSGERLLDEVSLFLHRVVAEMPEKKRQVITSLHDTDALLRGKKVLLVDDDMRTLFALTRILSDRGMQVLKAQNGRKALEILEQEPGVDVVFMDIMMPVLDGFETMKRIRSQERFKGLPIIALTAKAMPGDQDRCIQAGASDYLPKPIDQDRLLSMLRVWLYR